MVTFGSPTYVLKFCGKYYFWFLLIKFIVSLIVTVLRRMGIRRVTGASLGFGKTLINASYKFLKLSSNVNI